jgi:hypothetical protein
MEKPYKKDHKKNPKGLVNSWRRRHSYKDAISQINTPANCGTRASRGKACLFVAWAPLLQRCHLTKKHAYKLWDPRLAGKALLIRGGAPLLQRCHLTKKHACKLWDPRLAGKGLLIRGVGATPTKKPSHKETRLQIVGPAPRGERLASGRIPAHYPNSMR